MGSCLALARGFAFFFLNLRAFSFLVGAMSIISLCLSPAGGSILVLAICPAAERYCLLEGSFYMFGALVTVAAARGTFTSLGSGG